MTSRMNSTPLRLLLGTEHACGYLADRSARSAFVDPQFPLDPQRYGLLLDLGFRRSGLYTYRPACASCNACLPARIPVAQFIANRSQRRCLKRNADLEFNVEPALTAEHFALYRQYLSQRHAGGGMNPEDPRAFRAFLECAWGEVEFWTFRAGKLLLAVTVVDRVPAGLSAVYTFYDTDEAARSLGVLAVLKQIEIALLEERPYVYLGYWVEGSAKMDYKRHFRPLEILVGGAWRRLDETPASLRDAR